MFSEEFPDSDCISNELRSHVAETLGRHLRSFSIQLVEGGLHLIGECDSFHTKQLVQELVAKNTSLPILANELKVDV